MYSYQVSRQNFLPSSDMSGHGYYNERNEKRLKKVSKYKDKNGNIKIQIKECNNWIEQNIFGKFFYQIKSYCYKNFISFLEKMSFVKKRKAYIHKINDLKNGKYLKSRLLSIINKNRLYFDKIYKINGIQIYKEEDMCEFILLIIEAKAQKILKSFLDIPDVFYIIRQLKGIGLRYYVA